MSLKDLHIKHVYRSYGEDSISEMITPVLSHAISYKRSVGFFSSSSLKITSIGIENLIRNRNEAGLDNSESFIRFIASPYISFEDKKAIELGYETRKNIIKQAFINEFENALKELTDDNLSFLAELISVGFVDIRIVKTKGLGDYHDKFAIIEDIDNNIVTFNGSSNESLNGLKDNYERIMVFKSWEDSGIHYVNDDINEFDQLWNGTNEFNDTYDFHDAIVNSIIKVKEVRKNKTNGKPIPRPYQQEAIKAWQDNGNKGFYVMATGTGKTFTSLFTLETIINNEPLFTVIAVPYKHLVAQWYEDVFKLFPEIEIMKVSSEFVGWDKKLKDFLLLNSFSSKKKSIIIITTIKSFYSEKFNSAFKLNTMNTFLIVDEAHNFINKIYEKKYYIDYNYKIGLSATPVFGSDSKKTYDLLDFFGGEVYSLPIEKAIGKYLVNYNYHPFFIKTTEEDERKFKYFTQKMMASMKDGVIINEEEYTKAYRSRLRTISMAENKINDLEEIINSIDAKDHFIVYCSDGKIDNDENISKRHLNLVSEKLIELGFDPSQFTASEDMDTRMKLIEAFNKGDIHTLVAIRCLDEGINIPSINKALILSSNNNYREFVQRRGRILRQYKNKEIADIYDVILLPSFDCIDIAKIEFRRFNEYMKVSKNYDENKKILDSYLSRYGLNINDIQFDNEYLIGGDLDE